MKTPAKLRATVVPPPQPERIMAALEDWALEQVPQRFPRVGRDEPVISRKPRVTGLESSARA